MTKHILFALPALALGLTACSADDPEPKPQKPDVKSDGIALTIPLSSASTGIDTSPLNSKLTIVAYDRGGHKIETIVKNGKFVEGWSGNELGTNKIYEVSDYGSVMSLILSNEIYGGFLEGKGYIQNHDDENSDDEYAHNHTGIQLVAFYLPDESTKFGDDVTDFDPPYDLKDLSSEIKSNFILHHPAAENGIWTNAGENDMNIPMAGTLDITTAVQNYDPALWNEHNPMFLNNDPLMLVRTMAKVTIKSQDNFVTEASLKTANHGTLLSGNIGSDGVVKSVTVPDQTDFSNGFNILQNYKGEENKTFVFYTFERDLTGDNNKNLIEVKSDLGDKKFDFKPSDIADQFKNEWKGILRNHSYTFTILKPESSEMTVNVTVKEWENDHYNVNL